MDSFLKAASRQLFGTGIGRANDDARLTAHADIVRCYGVAITLAEAAQGRAQVGATRRPAVRGRFAVASLPRVAARRSPRHAVLDSLSGFARGPAAMAERTRRRKARSAGARRTSKRARPKARTARGKAVKPKKKTGRKPKAVTRGSRPSPRRPAKTRTPAATPQAPISAGGHPEPPTPYTRVGESGQASASEADNT